MFLSKVSEHFTQCRLQVPAVTALGLASRPQANLEIRDIRVTSCAALCGPPVKGGFVIISNLAQPRPARRSLMPYFAARQIRVLRLILRCLAAAD